MRLTIRTPRTTSGNQYAVRLALLLVLQALTVTTANSAPGERANEFKSSDHTVPANTTMLKRSGSGSALSKADVDKFLAMDFDEFDQSEKGWRSLRKKADKEDYLQTADLLDTYYKRRTDIRETQRNIVAFHAGQNYGFANETKEAIARFEKSFQKDQDDWNAYVNATIAFLKKDKKTLLAERIKLAEIPGQMNLSVVDRLISDFDSSYYDAYCGTSKKKH